MEAVDVRRDQVVFVVTLMNMSARAVPGTAATAAPIEQSATAGADVDMCAQFMVPS
jgi:hypothetical protein